MQLQRLSQKVIFSLVRIAAVGTEVPELRTLRSDGVCCIVVALDVLVPDDGKQLGFFQGLLQSEHTQPSITSQVLAKLLFA